MRTVTTSEARISLSKKLAEFRERGISSDPLIFGDHRKPEGVILPYELYSRLEDAIDQLRLEAATEVMDRIEAVIANPSRAVEVVRHKHKHA
jgi:antitoxin StbD